MARGTGATVTNGAQESARKLLVPGTEATVVGYPSRTDSIELRAERIRIGGRSTELR